MKIDGERLEMMKRLHLPTIMMELGVVLKVTGRDSCMGRCPFHEDKTPSLSVGKRGEKWLWNCFGQCQTGGNVIDFVMKKEKKSFGGAYEVLDAKLPPSTGANGNEHHKERVSPPTAPPAPSAASSVQPSECLARAVEVYHSAFCESKPAREYLAGRGIKDGELIRRFKVGFVNGRLRNMLPADPGHELVVGLKAAGILNEEGKEKFFNRVVFPIFDDNGAAVGLYGRGINGGAGATVPHLYLSGPHRGVWNGPAIKAHRDLILTESILDAMSLCESGLENAVPLYGTNGLTEDHLRLMKEHRTRRVFMCLDNDEAGERARGPLTEKLSALGIEVLSFDLPRKFKDPNEALMKGFPREEFQVLARIGSILSNARKVSALAGGTASAPGDIVPGASAPAGFAATAPAPAEPGPTAAATPNAAAPTVPAPVSSSSAVWPTVEEKEDGIHMVFARRRYRIGGLSARTADQLRVKVKVEDGEGSHVDLLPLYSSAARDKFVSCCRKVLSVEEGELHRELNRVIEILEGLRAKGKGGEAPGEKPPPVMTEEESAQSTAALKRPSLLADILADMDTLGYVGEDHNKTIGYLVGVSRKLENPLACVIVSQSSAGKSVLADTVERMTPPEDVVMYSRVTQYAIYYAAKDGLKHKLLILEERAGSEEADYPIRSLQSKKRLTLAVPVKDPATNQMRMEERVVEGPVAYMETTTNPRIHDENATRCFMLFLDESEEQTRRIHDRQRRAKTLAGFLTMGETDALVRRHHNMQRLLRPLAVVIPYADLIEFPVRWLRTRRDNMRFLNLIEVITFLYQFQRPVQKSIDGREYIEATVEDYAAAYSLAREIMGESFADLKKPQRELLRAIGEIKGAEDGPLSDGVTRRAIREATGLADTRLRELVADLVSLEYLREVCGGGQGRLSRYVSTERVETMEKTLVGLTTPEELRKRLAAVRLSKMGPGGPGDERPPSENVTDR